MRQIYVTRLTLVSRSKHHHDLNSYDIMINYGYVPETTGEMETLRERIHAMSKWKTEAFFTYREK